MTDSPIPCHEIDPQGMIRKVNQAECELLGYAASELIGHPIWEFVPTDSVRVVQGAIEQKVAHERGPAVLEREYRRSDGGYVLLEIHEKIIENAEGEVIGIRSALIDVTERNKMYAEMQRSNDRMRFVLQSSPRAVVIANAIGNVDLINRAAEALTGWQSADAVGHGLDKVCPVRLTSGEAVDLLSCIHTEPALLALTDAFIVDRAGNSQPIAGTVSAVRNDQDVIVGVTLVVEAPAAVLSVS